MSQKDQRLIVLAAGDAFELDGFPKLFARHPVNGKRILDLFCEFYQDYEITVSLGYRAIEIMSAYPHLNYVVNSKWRTTKNSYSLGLALDNRPTTVVCADYMMSRETALLLEPFENAALVSKNESRVPTSLNAAIDDRLSVAEIYPGKRRGMDPEFLGMVKISDPHALRAWKANCMAYPNLFVGENLPLDQGVSIRSVDIEENFFFEINNHQDYVRLLNETMGASSEAPTGVSLDA